MASIWCLAWMQEESKGIVFVEQVAVTLPLALEITDNGIQAEAVPWYTMRKHDKTNTFLVSFPPNT